MNSFTKSAAIIWVILSFVCGVSYGEPQVGNVKLDRIKAETGDGSKVSVKLRVGTVAKGEVRGISNKYPELVPRGIDPTLSVARGSFTMRADNGKEFIVVQGGCAVVISKPRNSVELPFDICGEFFVNESLELNQKGSWDGKKEGATHTLSGKVTIFDYEFQSNNDNPLTFKMTGEGYLYLGGEGTVKDLKGGKTYVLR